MNSQVLFARLVPEDMPLPTAALSPAGHQLEPQFTALHNAFHNYSQCT